MQHRSTQARFTGPTWTSCRCVIKGKWKLIYYPKSSRYHLFNLESDPNELSDLAHDPANKALIQELFSTLSSLQSELGDPYVPPPMAMPAR
ncbi:DUF4976 domain-containing protein [Pseudomonas sp. UL070]|uniref:DUF4976 domain-containing protein n=1 Tax=Aquipseudomonas ullengensis TaxID=2759166 RepID=A0A7W4QE78_9GAMM|nr:DUF4976 domain-containing protein [Pseudomonas ullengensis]